MKPIAGTWQIIRSEIRTRKGWQTLDEFPPGSFVWTFIQDADPAASDARNSAPRLSAQSGTLTEYTAENGSITAPYSFFPYQNKLYIDVSDTATDGLIRECVNEIYIVESLDPGRMTLYDTQQGELQRGRSFYRMVLMQG